MERDPIGLLDELLHKAQRPAAAPQYFALARGLVRCVACSNARACVIGSAQLLSHHGGRCVYVMDGKEHASSKCGTKPEAQLEAAKVAVQSLLVHAGAPLAMPRSTPPPVTVGSASGTDVILQARGPRT